MRKPFASIAYFVRNAVASHIVFIIITVVGILAIFNIQTQLIPNIYIPQIYVSFIWPGASAKQMESIIIEPAENDVQDIPGLNETTTVSKIGSATIALSFDQNQDLNTARQEVVQNLERINFPDLMEEWRVTIIDPKEQVARLLITDTDHFKLYDRITKIKNSLGQAGIQSTSTIGKPKHELVLTVDPDWLINQNMSMGKLARVVKNMLIELPTGFLGSSGQYTSTEVGLPFDQVKALNWAIKMPEQSVPEQAQDIFSDVSLRPSESSPRVFHNGTYAAEIRVFRPDYHDLLETANILKNWITEQADNSIEIYDETWSYFYDRLFLLGKNGLAGLVLIGLLLSYFLSRREALWVGMGLPISILGTLSFMYLLKFHISMISLFAMILSLGIIVDDAIVVAERYSTLHRFKNASQSAALAASQMVKPIMTSSFTTLAAFFPLLFISGVSGQFLREIPIVVITVIVASLIECFYILPKHLSLTNERQIKRHKSHIRFRHFRIKYFFPMIRASIDRKPIIITAAVAFVFLTLTLVSTGRVQFSFFPSFTSDRVLLQVDFTDKATFDQRKEFLEKLEQHAIKQIPSSILKQHYVVMNQSLSERSDPNPIRDGVQIWLIDQDKRDIDNITIVNSLRQSTPTSNLVNNIIIDQPRGGPPSDVLQLELTGKEEQLSLAITELKQRLNQFQGLDNIQDDISTPLPNYYFTLNDTLLFSDLDTQSLYTKLQSYLQDSSQFSLSYQGEEIDVVLMLPEYTRDLQADLLNVPIDMPNGAQLPLSSLAQISKNMQPQTLIRKDMSRTYTVSANVDSTKTNTYELEAKLYQQYIPEIEKTFDVTISSGKIKRDQSITINELKNGAIIGCALIFLILVWATNSFKLPLAILLTLPLSLTGGILGHWILGFDITLLSLFGFFGLMGVTVNDSIILTLQYQELLKKLPTVTAIKQAACDRFRAVILTSLTTVGGLLPLMFETSFQAQFLIPMAITIAFGLLFGTLWILLFLPAILSVLTHKGKS